MALIENTFGQGIERAALLMRHSAREFNREIHDLLNPLTDPGRDYCRRFGQALPKSLHVRGYHSPPERCAETVELVVDTHITQGGSGSRTRAVESLGVFYGLDQIKMWQAMQNAGGLPQFIREWGNGNIASDAMIPADLSAKLIIKSTFDRLNTAKHKPQLDICVSHDSTLMLIKDQLLGQKAEEFGVEFLDGVILFEQDEGIWLQSHHGSAREISALLA
ncbi:MAG: histidine phosphatase family protein [Pseudomonadota bacterium]